MATRPASHPNRLAQPDVTDTGVAALLVATAELVAKDGTAHTTALMLAHLHRSMCSVRLSLSELAEFLVMAEDVSPRLLLQTLLLSLPAMGFRMPADICVPRKRQTILLAADCIANASIRAAQKRKKSNGPLLAKDVVAVLPSMSELRPSSVHFDPVTTAALDRAPLAASADDVALPAAYLAARSKLNLWHIAEKITAPLRVDVLLEINSEQVAQRLRSEAEDPANGQNALVRMLEDFEWLFTLPQNTATVSNTTEIDVRVILLDATASLVAIDIVKRVCAAKEFKQSVCVVAAPTPRPGKPHGITPADVITGKWLDILVDAEDEDGMARFGNVELIDPDLRGDALLSIPCQLGVEALQMGSLLAPLVLPGAEFGLPVQPDIVVPHIETSLAPSPLYESTSHYAFRYAAGSLIAMLGTPAGSSPLTSHSALSNHSFSGPHPSTAYLVPFGSGTRIFALNANTLRNALRKNDARMLEYFQRTVAQTPLTAIAALMAVERQQGIYGVLGVPMVSLAPFGGDVSISAQVRALRTMRKAFTVETPLLDGKFAVAPPSPPSPQPAQAGKAPQGTAAPTLPPPQAPHATSGSAPPPLADAEAPLPSPPTPSELRTMELRRWQAWLSLLLDDESWLLMVRRHPTLSSAALRPTSFATVEAETDRWLTSGAPMMAEPLDVKSVFEVVEFQAAVAAAFTKLNQTAEIPQSAAAAVPVAPPAPKAGTAAPPATTSLKRVV